MSQLQPQPATLPLSTYPIDRVIQLWRNGEITADQAIGHLLQHVARLTTEGETLKKEVQRLQSTLPISA